MLKNLRNSQHLGMEYSEGSDSEPAPVKPKKPKKQKRKFFSRNISRKILNIK